MQMQQRTQPCCCARSPLLQLRPADGVLRPWQRGLQWRSPCPRCKRASVHRRLWVQLIARHCWGRQQERAQGDARATASTALLGAAANACPARPPLPPHPHSPAERCLSSCTRTRPAGGGYAMSSGASRGAPTPTACPGARGPRLQRLWLLWSWLPACKQSLVMRQVQCGHVPTSR